VNSGWKTPGVTRFFVSSCDRITGGQHADLAIIRTTGRTVHARLLAGHRNRPGERPGVGWRPETGHGHVSAALATFEPATLRGTSITGQHYSLKGEPGMNMDAAATPAQWCEATGADAHYVPRADLAIH
jgi:hypothetical protein